MKKSWVISALSLIVLVLLMTNIVLANDATVVFDNTNVADSIDAKLSVLSIDFAAERNELQRETKSLTETINAEQIVTLDDESQLVRQQEAIETYEVDYDSMYKVFTLNTDDIVKSFHVGNELFSSFITDTYLWEAPIRNQKSEVESSASFRKGISFSEFEQKSRSISFEDEETREEISNFVRANEGIWYWVRTGNMIPCEEVNFVSDSKALADYIESFGFSEVEDIRYVSLGIYRTDILYIYADGKEYGITFTLRPDLIGLENRKLYEIGDIVNTLPKMY